MSDIILENNLTFYAQTNSGGVPTDADAVPTYGVYEEENGTAILTGSMAKLDDAGTTGYYSEQIACTAANGFEINKQYSVRIYAEVSTVPGVTLKDINILPHPLTGYTLAELPVGIPPVNPTPEQAEMLNYMALRNAYSIDANNKKIRNDAGSTIAQKSLTDDDVTYNENKMESG